MSHPYIDVVFDGPPGPNTDGHHCNFVETEAPDGSGIGGPGFEWIQDGELWRLRITPAAFGADHYAAAVDRIAILNEFARLHRIPVEAGASLAIADALLHLASVLDPMRGCTGSAGIDSDGRVEITHVDERCPIHEAPL